MGKSIRLDTSFIVAGLKVDGELVLMVKDHIVVCTGFGDGLADHLVFGEHGFLSCVVGLLGISDTSLCLRVLLGSVFFDDF